MPIYDIFSKRQKRLRGEFPDVYQYETIPIALRNQVIHIWKDVFGPPIRQTMGGLSYSKAYKIIHDVLCREHGFDTLRKNNKHYFDAICKFLRETEDTDEVIDVIDISFQYIDAYVRSYPADFPDSEISPDEAIAELNHRFQQHGVGYQYESGQIIRVDSASLIHSEVVKPALSMLSDPMYEGANDEFLKAHEHYRTGKIQRMYEPIASRHLRVASKLYAIITVAPTVTTDIHQSSDLGIVLL